MGEQKRKELLGGDEKPKVVAVCPVCKQEYVADGKSKLLVNSYMVPVQQSAGQVSLAASLPMVICTQCGVQFFAGESLEELRKRAKGERSNLIIPRTKVDLSRVN